MSLPPSITLDPQEHIKKEVLVKGWHFTERQRSETKAAWILWKRRNREELGEKRLCREGL